MIIDEVKEWLEAKLDSDTESGDSEFTPGNSIWDVDPAYAPDQVRVDTEDAIIIFSIRVTNRGAQ